MAEQKCAGDHSQHMCMLAEARQMEVIRRLPNEVEYICLDCGRVANEEDSLCKAAHVDAIGIDER